MADLHCSYCDVVFTPFNSHWEYVRTDDPELYDCEYWYCCHACRDADQPCETFFKPEFVESE